MNSLAPQVFNPIELLTWLASTENSGLLEVNYNQVSWQVYLKTGQLQFASCSVQSLSQIDYHLRCLGYDSVTTTIKSIPISYLKSTDTGQLVTHELLPRAIRWLVAGHHLASEQAQQLVNRIVQENLESLLWLSHGTYSWTGRMLNAKSSVMELQSFLELFQKSLQAWQSVRDVVASPHQRPYLNSINTLQPSTPYSDISTATLEKLVKLMKGLSIRQLAAILHQEEVNVLQFLAPYIRNGTIYLREPQPPFDQLPTVPKLDLQTPDPHPTTKRRKIVCIDDSHLILDGMKKFLSEESFEVATIDNPAQSISLLFQFKPDLILLDITMPGINGYQLCSLLRKSDRHFETVPIIMVSGHRGIVDRARAKLAGATGYLTKPFTRELLLETLQKHLDVEINQD